MSFLTGALIFCVIALSWTDVAKGSELPSQEYDFCQAECSQPLPTHLAECVDKKIVNIDCGSPVLEVRNANTKEVVSYTLTDHKGVLIIVDNELSFVVSQDASSSEVVISRCVRSSVSGELEVFVLNGNGELCTTSGDGKGSVTYNVVTRSKTVYAPSTSVTLTTEEYKNFETVCATPLPEYFGPSAEKRIVENKEGQHVLSCTVPSTHVVVEFVLKLVPDTGVFTCEEGGIIYMVAFETTKLDITVYTAVEATFEGRTIVYVLNTDNALCSCWYDVNQSFVELISVTKRSEIEYEAAAKETEGVCEKPAEVEQPCASNVY